MRFSRKGILIATIAVVVVSGSARADEDDRLLDWYDWMFPAEIVVAGRALDEAGRNTAVRVERVFRGEVEPGEILEVEVRRANRDRDEDDRRLKLAADELYILLLKPDPPKDPDAATSYEIIRGTYGVRAVPREGKKAVIDAADRFAKLQTLNDDSVQWHAFEMMLEDNNPILLQTALDQYAKFMRGTPEILPRVEPLLHHPSPAIRKGALALTGFLLERYPSEELPGVESLETEIVALARRDPSTEVRIAAAVALQGLADDGIEEIWEEMSQDDPDQDVRYAAERLLYEREQELQSARPTSRR